jgi:hypothetical protein
MMFGTGKMVTESYELVQNAAMTRVRVLSYFRVFKDEHTYTESDEHHGRPSTTKTYESVAQLHDLVNYRSYQAT